MAAVRKLVARSGAKAEPRRGVIPESLIDHLASHDPIIASLPRKQQAALASYLFNSDTKRYRHRESEDLQCLFWKDLRNVFRGEFHNINERLGHWFILEIEARHHEGIARGFRVAEHAYALLEEWAFTAGTADRLVNCLGEPMKKPRTAINTLTANGSKSRFRGGPIQAYVPVDGDALHGLVSACHAWRAGTPAPAGFEWAHAAWNTLEAKTDRRKASRRVREVLLSTLKMYILAGGSAAKSFAVPVVYTEVESGRLYADGFTPQGCVRETKKAAFRGCWEYDGENMHWQLLYKLAKRAQPSLELPEIENYLRAKPFVRKRIANVAGITENEAKEVLISLIFGASIKSDDPAAAIPEIVGMEKLPALREAVKLLCRDMNKARDVVLEDYRERSRKQYRSKGLVNDAGRTLNTTSATPNRKAKELAHILQGLESEILRACINYAGESVVLLQHDGFTSSVRLSLAGLKKAVEEHVGMTIEIEETQL
ncbi:hypothetical protein VPH49_25730 [Pseudomonas luteola]|uniref:hypothetical protein n=1 Tax=Pseudomonas luteola TaxID=47886 RepID=UPI003A8B4322